MRNEKGWQGRLAIPADIVQEAVRRLVDRIAPDRVVLFGSAARGEMKKCSDLDLLVIKGGGYDYHNTIGEAYEAVAGVPVSADIVLVTPDQVAEFGGSPYLVIKRALQEGVLVYDREAVSA